MNIKDILDKPDFDRNDIVALLECSGSDRDMLFARSSRVKEQYVGKRVYFRGLIEFSNICQKDCLYCGIRKGNKNVNRFSVSDEEILDSVKFALENHYASVVLQSGELNSTAFTDRVENLLLKIRDLSNGEIRVTLSLGEQSEDTYTRWFNAGAHRYLLRIESSNPDLYRKIHPGNPIHDFNTRMKCLQILKQIGYQTGTGVMIGLPFQTTSDLAGDLLFFKQFDIDMVGMGPYIEHSDTPLFAYREQLLPLKDRFDLSLKMIAVLRLMMKDINIAATTALQTIDKAGREKALKIGANVMMPNITPGEYRNDYLLYQNKPCTDENAEDCKNCLEARIHIAGDEIAWDDWGDSRHYRIRNDGE